MGWSWKVGAGILVLRELEDKFFLVALGLFIFVYTEDKTNQNSSNKRSTMNGVFVNKISASENKK